MSLFVYTGYVHSACDLQSVSNVGTTEVTAHFAGHSSDTPANLSLDNVHCHGCTTAAVPLAAQALEISAVTTKPQMAAVSELLASDLQFEPPPPKA